MQHSFLILAFLIVTSCNFGYENEIYQSSLIEPYSLSEKERQFIALLKQNGFENIKLEVPNLNENENNFLGYKFEMNYISHREKYDPYYMNTKVDSLISLFLKKYSRDSLIYSYSYIDFSVKITDSIEPFESTSRFLDKLEIEHYSGFKIIKSGHNYIRKKS